MARCASLPGSHQRPLRWLHSSTKTAVSRRRRVPDIVEQWNELPRWRLNVGSKTPTLHGWTTGSPALWQSAWRWQLN